MRIGSGLRLSMGAPAGLCRLSRRALCRLLFRDESILGGSNRTLVAFRSWPSGCVFLGGGSGCTVALFGGAGTGRACIAGCLLWSGPVGGFFVLGRLCIALGGACAFGVRRRLQVSRRTGGRRFSVCVPRRAGGRFGRCSLRLAACCRLYRLALGGLVLTRCGSAFFLGRLLLVLGSGCLLVCV